MYVKSRTCDIELHIEPMTKQRLSRAQQSKKASDDDSGTQREFQANNSTPTKQLTQRHCIGEVALQGLRFIAQAKHIHEEKYQQSVFENMSEAVDHIFC